MRETIEFRVPEENAAEHLPAGIGVHLGWIRKVTIGTSDPLFIRIGELQREFRAQGREFFFGWDYHRHYSPAEFEAAEVFCVHPGRAFEPAGEECGTHYDDTKACPECGAGAPQVSPLFLKYIPKGPDFAVSIAGEIIVSSRVSELFRERGLRGAEFDPVRLADKDGAPCPDHYQLNVVGPYAELDPITRAGEGPFDETMYGRCSRGDLVGLQLLSEVTVKRESWGGADICATAQMVWAREGLIRPRRLLLLSPRAWHAFREAGLKGLVIEVAHLNP